MSDDKAYAAPPFDELERQIMDVNFAKNEREWWAWREICELRAENEKLRAALKPFAKECERLVAEYHRPENVMRPTLTAGELRAAAAALKETGDE